MRSAPFLATLTMLAACGQPAPPPPARRAPAADGYAAKVAALPAKLRGGVMMRAIRDAGQECQQVIEVQSAPIQNGASAWVATCDDHRVWVVIIADDGTARVADARDVAGRH